MYSTQEMSLDLLKGTPRSSWTSNCRLRRSPLVWTWYIWVPQSGKRKSKQRSALPPPKCLDGQNPSTPGCHNPRASPQTSPSCREMWLRVAEHLAPVYHFETTITSCHGHEEMEGIRYLPRQQRPRIRLSLYLCHLHRALQRSRSGIYEGSVC
jgi:hypothetical protein